MANFRFSLYCERFHLKPDKYCPSGDDSCTLADRVKNQYPHCLGKYDHILQLALIMSEHTMIGASREDIACFLLTVLEFTGRRHGYVEKPQNERQAAKNRAKHQPVLCF